MCSELVVGLVHERSPRVLATLCSHIVDKVAQPNYLVVTDRLARLFRKRSTRVMMLFSKATCIALQGVSLILLLLNIFAVGASGTNSYKSCEESCEVGRCHYKDCKKSVNCRGGLCTFWGCHVSIYALID